MSPWRLDRRELLRALGIGAATLPFVPLLDAQAETTPVPKRLLFFFSSNGTIHESWLPKMVENRLELSPILAPLEKHRERLVVVDGLCHKVILDKSGRTGHGAAMNTLLTGRNSKILDPSKPLQSLATGVSLDQFLARRLAADTKLPTIECGVGVEKWGPDSGAISYQGALAPMMPESSPYQIFERLFGKKGRKAAGAPEDESSVADRQRVFDAVSLELASLQTRLPRADRLRLEEHLGALRAVGHSLTRGVGAAAGSACVAPELGRPLDPLDNDSIPQLARMQMDLLVMALACDLTRIGTVQFGRAGSSHRFNWLGPEFETDPYVPRAGSAISGFHALAHWETHPPSRAKLVRIHTWFATQLAYLLDRLDAIPERGGTMLDNTVVVWINELGTGGDHGHLKTPWVIAGNAGGYFKTGRLASFPEEPHNRILLTLAHAMGVHLEEFGDPDYCSKGPLTGVTA